MEKRKRYGKKKTKLKSKILKAATKWTITIQLKQSEIMIDISKK